MAIGSTQRGEIRQLKDLDDHLMEQIESFFVTYAALTDKKVKPLRPSGSSVRPVARSTGFDHAEAIDSGRA